MQKHTIRNPLFEIIWNVNSLAWNKWDSNLKDLIYYKLLPIAEKVFDEMIDENTIIKIDSLNINLGEMALSEVQSKIPEIFERKLRDALNDKIPQVKRFKPNIQSTKDERWQAFTYFLETGRDTWWISISPTQQQEINIFENKPLTQLFKQITEESPELLRIFLKQQPINSALMQRFFQTISFEKWLDALYLHRKEIVIFWQNFFNELVFLLSKKTFKPVQALKNELYQFILKKAIDDNYFFGFGNEKDNIQIEFLEQFFKNLPQYFSEFSNYFSKKSLLLLKISPKDIQFFIEIMNFFKQNSIVKNGFLSKNIQKTFEEYVNILIQEINKNPLNISLWQDYENILPQNQKNKLQLFLSVYKSTIFEVLNTEKNEFLEQYFKKLIVNLSIFQEQKIFLQPNFEQITIDFFQNDDIKYVKFLEKFTENLQKNTEFEKIVISHEKQIEIQKIVEKQELINNFSSELLTEKNKENEVFLEKNLIDILQTILGNQAQEILQLLQKLSDSFRWFQYSKPKWKQILWENLSKVLWENRFQISIDTKKIITQFFQNLKQNINAEDYVWQNFLIRNDINNTYSFVFDVKNIDLIELEKENFVLINWIVTLQKYSLNINEMRLIDKFWIEIAYIFMTHLPQVENTLMNVFMIEVEKFIQKNKSIETKKTDFLWTIIQKLFENFELNLIDTNFENDLNKIVLFKENKVKLKKVINSYYQINKTNNINTFEEWKTFFGIENKVKREKILRELLPQNIELILKFLNKIEFKLSQFRDFMAKIPAERQKITWEILVNFFYQNQKNEQWTTENIFIFFENYLFQTLKIYPQYYADVIELVPAARKRVRNINYIEKIVLYFWQTGQFAWTEIWKFYTGKLDNSLEKNMNLFFEFLAENNPSRLLEIIKTPISNKNYQKILQLIENQDIKNAIIENKQLNDIEMEDNILTISTIYQSLIDLSNQKIDIKLENLVYFYENNEEIFYQIWKKFNQNIKENLLKIYPEFFEKVNNIENVLTISTIYQKLIDLSNQKISIKIESLEQFYRYYPEYLHLIWKNLDENIKQNLLNILPIFFEKLDLEVQIFAEQFEKIGDDILKNDYLPRLEERKDDKDDLKTLEKLKELAKKSLYKKKEWQNEPMYVANAGAVILHPYLWRLFGVLDMLENNALKDEIAQTKAVHLINYLVFKSIEGEESQWILNKILLGIPIEQTLVADITLTEKEMETCESLLKGIVSNWTALNQTSNDNLRISFLQREGKLTDEPDNWVLRVQSSGFDILLERLPWGLNPLKTPAMKKIMVVEWI
ncbi:MAG: hypothetical protein EAZ85_04465 [Bacteroidetes bacterium]|nr:MAG: hypothetical protein EAZ85_04465 [Bacteroidota bacterium]